MLPPVLVDLSFRINAPIFRSVPYTRYRRNQPDPRHTPRIVWKNGVHVHWRPHEKEARSYKPSDRQQGQRADNPASTPVPTHPCSQSGMFSWSMGALGICICKLRQLQEIKTSLSASHHALFSLRERNFSLSERSGREPRTNEAQRP